MIGERPGWHARAACRGDVETMFPVDELGVSFARLVCMGCPVVGECREWAIRNVRGSSLDLGVWAGMTSRQIKRLRSKLGVELEPIDDPLEVSA